MSTQDEKSKQKKVLKNDIKYQITLNDEQKEAKRLIIDNQIVVITGRAGCGKSLVSAQTALDFVFKKQFENIYVTRAAVEVGHSLGFLPGSLNEKFNPYLVQGCEKGLRFSRLMNHKNSKNPNFNFYANIWATILV
jgi:phosphate starvation-inducible protein PhoH